MILATSLDQPSFNELLTPEHVRDWLQNQPGGAAVALQSVAAFVLVRQFLESQVPGQWFITHVIARHGPSNRQFLLPSWVADLHVQCLVRIQSVGDGGITYSKLLYNLAVAATKHHQV